MLFSRGRPKLLLMLLLFIEQSMAEGKPRPYLEPGLHWRVKHCHALLPNDPCFTTPGTQKYCVSEDHRVAGKGPAWLNLNTLSSSELDESVDLNDVLPCGGNEGDSSAQAEACVKFRSDLDSLHVSSVFTGDESSHNGTLPDRLVRRSNVHDWPCCQVTWTCYKHIKMMRNTHLGGHITEKDGDDYWRMWCCIGAWERSCGIRHLDNWPHFNPPPQCSNP